MKKFYFLFLATMLLLGLTACGSEESASSDKSEEKVEEQTEETTSTQSEEAAKPEVNENAKYAEMFKITLPAVTEKTLELSQESYDFIVSNHTLFPAKTDADINKAKQIADASITAKHLNKNAQPYFTKMATFQGTVVTVEEVPLDGGETVSVTHVIDNEMNSYQVIMYKGTGDILEDDTVRFWGAPVGPYSFENVSGGSTNVQVFFGSHMQKM
ncbi:hypothetical protein ACFOU2_19395 [Bacillus songklensis]|uniref:Lipoprotein n=1 Tax=Bacillus songklensis TaxID=1069116 RepID=A0ABV8B5S6_9BACI